MHEAELQKCAFVIRITLGFSPMEFPSEAGAGFSGSRGGVGVGLVDARYTAPGPPVKAPPPLVDVRYTARGPPIKAPPPSPPAAPAQVPVYNMSREEEQEVLVGAMQLRMRVAEAQVAALEHDVHVLFVAVNALKGGPRQENVGCFGIFKFACLKKLAWCGASAAASRPARNRRRWWNGMIAGR